MKTTTEGEISVQEIKEAIKFWLECKKKIIVHGEIHFHIEGRSDPDDWRAEYPLSYELDGAYFKVKQ